MFDNSKSPDFFKAIGDKRKGSVKGRWDGRIHIEDADAYPCLTHLMTSLPPGAMRGSKLGRVAFFVQDGRLTACLAIPGMTTVGFLALEGFQNALSALEDAIKDGLVDWREDKQNGKR